MANAITDDLRKEVREAARLHHCEHEHDFNALANSIIVDLEVLAARYKDRLQALYAEYQ